MRQDFLHYIREEDLFNPETEVLLIAISGGIDSVVLAHLCHTVGIRFALAHCNFQLRGKESDADAFFVKQLARQLAVPYVEVAFETQKVARERKQSIQVIARELRYDWLEIQRQKLGCQYIATAHHLNDAIETVFLNLSYGCGIRGMHGILPKQDYLLVVRPLLFSSRAAIEAYASTHQLSWREDSSNLSLKYRRNQIRHQIIPEFQEVNPAFEQVFAENLRNFREAEWLFDYAIEEWKAKLLEPGAPGESWRIPISKLKALPVARTFLFELLHPLGFAAKTMSQILEGLSGESGAIYYSPTHRLLRGREALVLQARTDAEVEWIELEEPSSESSWQVDLPEYSLHFSWLEATAFAAAPKGPKWAYLDADRLVWPLRLRRWQAGDGLQPLGMQGQHKKLSSLFKDLKLSVFAKEQVWLLEDQQAIAWVVGLRADERFKVRKETKKVLWVEVVRDLR